MQSDHTKLINRFIGLCQKEGRLDQSSKPWPNPLYELGYRVDLVEQQIRMRGGDTVHPDILVSSNRYLHVLVAECKSGKNIDIDQDRRYADLTTVDLESFVQLHDRNQLKHDVCYVDDIKNHDSLSPHTNLPFITFGREHVQKHGKFRLDKLDQKLSQPIPLGESAEPSSYYPFSPSDDDEFVVPHVLRAFVMCLTSKDNASRAAVLESGVTSMIMAALNLPNFISNKHKKQMQERVKRIVGMLFQRDGFGDLVGRAAEYDHAAIRTLSSRCAEICSEYETQRRLTDSFER